MGKQTLKISEEHVQVGHALEYRWRQHHEATRVRRLFNEAIAKVNLACHQKQPSKVQVRRADAIAVLHDAPHLEEPSTQPREPSTQARAPSAL